MAERPFTVNATIVMQGATPFVEHDDDSRIKRPVLDPFFARPIPGDTTIYVYYREGTQRIRVIVPPQEFQTFLDETQAGLALGLDADGKALVAIELRRAILEIEFHKKNELGGNAAKYKELKTAAEAMLKGLGAQASQTSITIRTPPPVLSKSSSGSKADLLREIVRELRVGVFLPQHHAVFEEANNALWREFYQSACSSTIAQIIERIGHQIHVLNRADLVIGFVRYSPQGAEQLRAMQEREARSITHVSMVDACPCRVPGLQTEEVLKILFGPGIMRVRDHLSGNESRDERACITDIVPQPGERKGFGNRKRLPPILVGAGFERFNSNLYVRKLTPTTPQLARTR